jgi:hypothetical protein
MPPMKFTELLKNGWPVLLVPGWLALVVATLCLWIPLMLAGSALLYVFWWLPGEAARFLRDSSRARV